ncbi:hypothetical protein C8R44DRAFT_753909 [Mycena epipterygia]|nr:hypothetical protein C8R44DRAFT_753909 [Mycena epipterygia]
MVGLYISYHELPFPFRRRANVALNSAFIYAFQRGWQIGSEAGLEGSEMIEHRMPQKHRLVVRRQGRARRTGRIGDERRKRQLGRERRPHQDPTQASRHVTPKWGDYHKGKREQAESEKGGHACRVKDEEEDRGSCSERCARAPRDTCKTSYDGSACALGSASAERRGIISPKGRRRAFAPQG